MFIDQQHILQETNGGLDIILHYYPQASNCVNNKRKFKLRDNEKTASATLKKLTDGNYVVTDFGGDQKPRNAVQVCILEESVDFKAACQILAGRYGIMPQGLQPDIYKPDISSRPATAEENEGEWYFDIRPQFTELDIKAVLADKVIPYKPLPTGERVINFEKIEKVFKRYHFYSLESYHVVKNRKVTTISATEHYPIMMFDEGPFKKIYQPLSPDKSRRFMYYGKRPKDFIHGLSVCAKAFDDLNEEDEDKEKKEEGETSSSKKKTKLDAIIYCSGGSDALNLAMLSYQVVWGNSETAKLSTKDFKKLASMADKVMNMPDIDETGKREAHRLAMEHLELHNIILPDSLKERYDKRGNACKDLRDYLKYYNGYDFKQLANTALPYQFWDVEWTKTKSGAYKANYIVRNTRLYNFLGNNGFFRYEQENKKEGYIYIHIQDNIVREIKANEVKAYINQFFVDRMLDEDLRDVFYRSTQLGESSMSNLPLIEIDFTDYDRDTQYFFYKNQTVKVTAKGIKSFMPGEVNRYVWDDEVIRHKYEHQEPHFKIQPGADEHLDIQILKKDNTFFNYLINTSRMFWRKELEDSLQGKSAEELNAYKEKHKFDIAGPNLAAEEIKEQKDHLINKIYTLGYLLHRYKDPSRPWAVFAMDHRVSDDGESHGGSGKSIAYKAVRHFMKSVTLDGRKPKLTDDQFIYENVTRHTDYILVDDANQYLNFQFFFAPLTGELTVNPKNNQRFIIPFEDVPKFSLTSNFVIRNLDSSTERRLLYAVFSDYYHQNSNEFYNETRSPKDDFGKNILNEDFTEAEWNDFYNFMQQCCSFYMNHDKIEPPMNNVEKRNLLSIMGNAFHSWADVYFSEENNTLNVKVDKLEAFETFKKATGAKLWTAQKFTKSIRAWCQYQEYELNPKDLQNAQGRIIGRATQPDGTTKSVEQIYIKTTKTSLHNPIQTAVIPTDQVSTEPRDIDDIPF